MGPLFSYYGSKTRLSKHYPEPKFDTIIEPFAGAAGYSCRYPHKNVILYEKDDIIASVLDFLIKSSPEEIRNLPLIPPGYTVDDFDIPQEAKWMIGFWLASAKQRPNKRLSKWASTEKEWPNISAKFWGPSCRDRLSDTVSHIKHWKVYNESWENSERHTENATWFIDPPYQVAGIYYRQNNKNIDFNNLGEWCKTRLGQTIVCESEGADWLPFEKLCDLRGIGKGRKKSTEVVYYHEND